MVFSKLIRALDTTLPDNEHIGAIVLPVSHTGAVLIQAYYIEPH